MIYATGDTHGNFQRFDPKYFPEQAGMTRDDYMIICGDFGGVWDDGKKEERDLDWLEDLPFTTLFVSGNHENFDRLKNYPVEEWRKDPAHPPPCNPPASRAGLPVAGVHVLHNGRGQKP